MVKEQIVQWATKDFARLGIKGVSMSHIAQELRISKKTIYDYFSSKQELITECINDKIRQNTQTLLEVERTERSTMEKILFLNKITLEQSLSLCPAFYYEITKITYVTQLLEKHVAFIYEQYRIYFQRGIEEGFFPKDYNCESALVFFEEQIKAICFHSVQPEMKRKEMYATTIFTYLAGICTDKGREELTKFNRNQFYN